VPKLIVVLNNDRLNDSVRTTISRRVHRRRWWRFR